MSAAAAVLPVLERCRQMLAGTPPYRRIGWVRRVQGLAIEAEGPDVPIGAMCRIMARTGQPDDPGILAEVVAIRPGHVTLMCHGAHEGVGAGCEVLALHEHESGAGIAVGEALLGRVIDCFGQPLDGRPLPPGLPRRSLRAAPGNPLLRPLIDTVLETGVRCIDGLLTIGRGQRVGIFSGSGVGKSSLLAMITRHMGSKHCVVDDSSPPAHGQDSAGNAARADLNVIALIGERSREVRDFIERQLGADGLAHSIVVVATAEQPALSRIRAAHAAVAIAEHFCQSGRHVLLTMDSITRLAMARREVGLAAGEPATARGYTPSVFTEIPQLCERCGTAPSGGAITALLTVLVEGDDFNEPVSDCLRAVLDGHIVLTRTLAHRAHFPPIDVLQSSSRLARQLSSPAEREIVAGTLRHLALLEHNRAMVDIGAYAAGSNPALDLALLLEPALLAWQRQDSGGISREQALQQLARLCDAAATPLASAPSTGSMNARASFGQAPSSGAETRMQR
ncbi:MAG: FliI/YscN family ATPase [Janthinobacterium lividum]